MGKLGLVLSLAAQEGVQGKAEPCAGRTDTRKWDCLGSPGPSHRLQIPFQGRLGTGNARGLQGLSLHLPAQVSGVLFWVLCAHLPDPKASPRGCLIPNIPGASSSQTSQERLHPNPSLRNCLIPNLLPLTALSKCIFQELPHPKPPPKSCLIPSSWNISSWNSLCWEGH